MNIIPATIAAAGSQTTVTLTGGMSVTLDVATDASEAGKQASFGVRPEDLRIADGADYVFEGEVSIVEALGEVTLLYIEGLVPGERSSSSCPASTTSTRARRCVLPPTGRSCISLTRPATPIGNEEAIFGVITPEIVRHGPNSHFLLKIGCYLFPVDL